MVIFMCFFPIAISFTEALAQCDEEQISLLKSFGASTFQIYRMVKIPSAASALFFGLQVSATYCIGGAIVGEWLSAAAGLGYYMIRVKNGYIAGQSVRLRGDHHRAQPVIESGHESCWNGSFSRMFSEGEQGMKKRGKLYAAPCWRAACAPAAQQEMKRETAK